MSDLNISNAIFTLHGTSAMFAALSSPIPKNIACHEIDTGKIKLTDGISTYAELSFFTEGAEFLRAQLVVTDNGSDVSGITLPGGGTGLRGYISAIYQALQGSAPVVGQFKLTQANQPVQLPEAVLTNGITIKAGSTNSGPIFIGDSTVNGSNDGTGTGYPLAPGESKRFRAANLNMLYAYGAANDFLYYSND